MQTTWRLWAKPLLKDSGHRAGTGLALGLAPIGCRRDGAGSADGPAPPRGGACAWASRRRRQWGSELRVGTRRSAAPSAPEAEPEAPRFDPGALLFLKGQPSSSRPCPPALLPAHPEAEAPSLGGAAQPELPDPEEAPSPASAMEPTAPSLTEEDLTEVKKDVSSTAQPGRRGGPGAGGVGLQPSGPGKRKPGVRVRVRAGACGSEERKVQAPQRRGEP